MPIKLLQLEYNLLATAETHFYNWYNNINTNNNHNNNNHNKSNNNNNNNNCRNNAGINLCAMCLTFAWWMPPSRFMFTSLTHSLSLPLFHSSLSRALF